MNTTPTQLSSETRIPVPQYFLYFFGLLAALGPFAVDAYLPAMPMMAKAFGVNIVAMNNTVVTFLLGYAFGQLFGGPISDQVGRKTVATIGLTVFILSTLLILLASNVEQMQILRSIQAIGGGFSTIICMASIRDVYPAHEAGRRYALVMVIVMIAPLIAPVLGAFLLDFGWEAIFVFLLLYAIMALAIYLLTIPETRVVKEKKLDFAHIITQYKGVFVKKVRNRYIPIRYALTITFSAASILIFVTNASFVYIEFHGASEKMFTVYFGANIILMTILISLSTRLMKFIFPHKLMLIGCAVQLIAAAVLFTLAYTDHAHFFAVFPCIIIIVGICGLISPNAAAVFISYYDQLSGSASSINNTLLFVMGALLGGLTSFFYDASLLPMAAIMLLSSLLSNLVAWSIPSSVMEDWKFPEGK